MFSDRSNPVTNSLTHVSAKTRGRSMRVPLPNRWITDMLVCARKVPSIPVLRRMDLKALVELRPHLEPRPSWVTIFAKAFSLVAREVPQLRRAYLGKFFPRIYEHPTSVASIAIERDFEGEDAVLFGRLVAPDIQSLTGLTERLHQFKTAAVDGISSYRELMRISRLPRPLRRLAWWFGLNINGYLRAKLFGTFGVSAYAQLGAESLHPISPLTTLLTYGQISPAGAVDVRLVYDHRVMNGSTVARALVRLEEVLQTEMVTELRGMRGKSDVRAAA
jgi:hypothetical protein